MFSLINAYANISDAIVSVMTTITNNELLFSLFVGSLVFMGASIVGKIKRTSKR